MSNNTCGEFFNGEGTKNECDNRTKKPETIICDEECNTDTCCPPTNCEEWDDDNDCNEGTIDKDFKCPDDSSTPCDQTNCCSEKEETSTVVNILKWSSAIPVLLLAVVCMVQAVRTSGDERKEYGSYFIILLYIIGTASYGVLFTDELSLKKTRFLQTIMFMFIGLIFIMQGLSAFGFLKISELPIVGGILKKLLIVEGDTSPLTKSLYIFILLSLLLIIGQIYRTIARLIKESGDKGADEDGETTDTFKNINNYLTKNNIDDWVNIVYVFILVIICIIIKNYNLNDTIKIILGIIFSFISIFKFISVEDRGWVDFSTILSSVCLFIIIILSCKTLPFLKTKLPGINIEKIIIPLLIFEIIVYITSKNFYNVFTVKEEKNDDYETREISVIKVVYLSLIVTIILKSIKELDKYLDIKKTILFFIILTIILLSITSNKWYERGTDPSTDGSVNCAYDNSLINYHNNKQIEIDLELRKNVYIDDNVLFFIIITILFILILKDGDNIKNVGIFIIFIISYSLIYFVGKLIKDEKITSFDMSTNDEKTTCNEGIDSDCNSSNSTIYKRNKRGLLKCGSLSITDYYIRRIAGISIKDIRNSENTKYSTFQKIKICIRLVIFFGIIYLIYKPVKKKFDKSYEILIMVTFIFMIIIPLFGRILLSDSPLNDNPGPAEYIDDNIKNNVYYETIGDYMSYVFKNPFSRALSKRESVYKDNGTMNPVVGIRKGTGDSDDCSENCNETKPNFMNDYGGLIILLIMIIILVIKIVLGNK